MARRSNNTAKVWEFISNHKGSPTYQEITNFMGFKSRNSAFYHVRKLIKEQKVYIANRRICRRLV